MAPLVSGTPPDSLHSHDGTYSVSALSTNGGGGDTDGPRVCFIVRSASLVGEMLLVGTRCFEPQ